MNSNDLLRHEAAIMRHHLSRVGSLIFTAGFFVFGADQVTAAHNGVMIGAGVTMLAIGMWFLAWSTRYQP